MVLECKEIKYKGKRIFEKLEMTLDFKRAPKYFQEDEACFLFLSEGSFQFRTPTNVQTYNKNEAMLAKCGNYFIERIPVDGEGPEDAISVIGAFFYPDIVKELFQTDLSIGEFHRSFDATKVDVQPLMKSFIDSLNFLFDNLDIVDDVIVTNKLKELLFILSKGENSTSINAFISSLFVPHEYDFNEIVQKNVYSDLKIKDFAMLCNCSEATFKRKFKSTYGESPVKYFTRRKLEKACQLLQIKSKPIGDIAYECGFPTVTNFNRSFKAHFKKTPSQFRLS